MIIKKNIYCKIVIVKIFFVLKIIKSNYACFNFLEISAKYL